MAAVQPVEINEKGHSVYRCRGVAGVLLVEGGQAHPGAGGGRGRLHDRARRTAAIATPTRNPFGQKTPADACSFGGMRLIHRTKPNCCVNVPIKAVTTDRMVLKPGRQGEVPECPPCVGCF